MTDKATRGFAAPQETSETEQTRDLISRFVEAWFAADADRMVTMLDQDANLRPPGSIAPAVTGRGHIAAGFAGAAAGQFLKLDTLKRAVNSMVVDGRQATVLVHLEAETLAGASYINEYCWFFECQDEVIIRITEYADTLLAARLGFVSFHKDEGKSQWLPAT